MTVTSFSIWTTCNSRTLLLSHVFITPSPVRSPLEWKFNIRLFLLDLLYCFFLIDLPILFWFSRTTSSVPFITGLKFQRLSSLYSCRLTRNLKHCTFQNTRTNLVKLMSGPCFRPELRLFTHPPFCYLSHESTLKFQTNIFHLFIIELSTSTYSSTHYQIKEKTFTKEKLNLSELICVYGHLSWVNFHTPITELSLSVIRCHSSSFSDDVHVKSRLNSEVKSIVSTVKKNIAFLSLSLSFFLPFQTVHYYTLILHRNWLPKIKNTPSFSM